MEKWLGAAKDGKLAALQDLLSSARGGVDMVHTVIDPMDSAKGGIKNKELSGRTALSLAARYGHDECIKFLLESKASVQKQQYEVSGPVGPTLLLANRFRGGLCGLIPVFAATRCTPLSSRHLQGAPKTSSKPPSSSRRPRRM